MPAPEQMLSLVPDLPVLAPATEIPSDAAALVVGLVDPAAASDSPGSAKATGSSTVKVASPALSADQADALTAVAQAVGASAKIGAATALAADVAGIPALVVAAGLGASAEDVTKEELRQAAGAAGRAARGHESVAFAFPAVAELAEEVALGAALGGYRPAKVTHDDADARNSDTFHILGASDAAVRRAATIALGVARARDFVNTPPNLLFPESFAARAAELGAAAGLSVDILDADALREGGYGGICGVGGGSARGPRLLRMAYSGADGAPTVALVGKGVTFDTGGISIKPAAGMEAMTSDMSGAAAVIGTVLTAAELGLAVNVVATVPMAENMPGGHAYRPGDVLSMYGGTTVEITNTDAEGRLILADAIVRACEDSPQYLIDTATLTGAQMVALGKRTPGVMGTDAFRDRVAKLSAEIGENGWAMPLPEELRRGLDSNVADMVNSASSRWGGMLVAALFLKEFVGEGVEWAHIDVAGPAYNDDSANGYQAKGGTGVPVRTMLAVLEDIAAHG